MRFFFFGTLMDADLRALVLGRAVPQRFVHPARLEGFRRVRVANENYPCVLAHGGAGVDGITVDGLGADDLSRLLYFEGDDYRPARARVRRPSGAAVSASVFLATENIHATTDAWLFDDWRRRHKPYLVQRLPAFMARFDPNASGRAIDALWRDLCHAGENA